MGDEKGSHFNQIAQFKMGSVGSILLLRAEHLTFWQDPELPLLILGIAQKAFNL